MTNACAEYVKEAKQHGIPNVGYLTHNLKEADERCARYGNKIELLLVCGKVAGKTYLDCTYTLNCRTVFMPHPAARRWSAKTLLEAQACICNMTEDLSLSMPKYDVLNVTVL